jgi:hypothetical protein
MRRGLSKSPLNKMDNKQPAPRRRDLSHNGKQMITREQGRFYLSKLKEIESSHPNDTG